jgi:hypothetical protein
VSTISVVRNEKENSKNSGNRRITELINAVPLPTNLDMLLVISRLAHLARDCIRLRLELAEKWGSPLWIEIGSQDKNGLLAAREKWEGPPTWAAIGSVDIDGHIDK